MNSEHQTEPHQTIGFKEAYATLKSTAEHMRSQTEPDIDSLVPMVDKAVAAYQVCKSRISAVHALLEQKLGQNAGAM